jgi:hypothetical protein
MEQSTRQKLAVCRLTPNTRYTEGSKGEAYLFSKQCEENVPEPQLIVMLFVRPDNELTRLAIMFYRIETL